jgi:hypothetical protein
MREKPQYVHQLMHIAFLLRSFILHLTGYKSVHRDQLAKSLLSKKKVVFRRHRYVNPFVNLSSSHVIERRQVGPTNSTHSPISPVTP